MPTSWQCATTMCCPASNNACQQHVLRLHRRLHLPAPMDARGMRSLLADGSSCQPQWLQAACTKTSPAAAPASNHACKRHALGPRRRQHLPASMEANGMRRSRAACIKTSPAAAPASNDARTRHALGPCRRQTLPATLDVSGMRWFLVGGSFCQQPCMRAACAEASPAATPANSNGCKGHALVPRRRQHLPTTVPACGMH